MTAPPLNGRVVRLHFKCRAELPIGSYLRVTGCTLWAPGTSAQDPTDAHQIAKEEALEGFPVRDPEEEAAANLDMEGVGGFDEETTGMPTTQSMYTSSVELVTTPEEYPIWRTRRPVVVVLHKHPKQIQHHFYRYMVVTPGATTETGALTMAELAATSNDDDDGGDGMLDAGGGVNTSEENTGSTRVMMWEDPFQSLQKSAASGLSLDTTKSFITDKAGVTKNSLINLPYRTFDIDVSTATPILEEDAADVRVDSWNNRDDISFRPYLIRDAMNVENRTKKSLHRRMASGQSGGPYSSDVAMSDAAAAATNLDGSGASGGTTPIPPSPSQIYFVCFHLPVVVVQNQDTKEWRASWSESLMARTEGSRALKVHKAHWVGTVTTHPPIASEDDKVKVRALLAEMDCTPIFLDPAVRQAHYYGFCKQVLWPAFHNIDLSDLSASGLVGLSHEASDWDQSRLGDWWASFQDVNSIFANLVAGMCKPSDIVWVHDYHLALLPMMMQQLEVAKFNRTITRKIFFLHIPFPTSQIFRELECGEAILEGMLHADVVGFHAFDHARHFLNAAKRILGLNYESLVGGLIGVNFHGKTVLVTMSNVSIEPKQVDAVLSLPSVHSGLTELKQKHNGRMIVCGVDIGQQLSGIALKLLAFERLLQDYPNWQSRVVMVQRVLLPGSRKADEAFTVRELHAVVKRIQDKFGTAVIDYQESSGSSYPMDQRLALWKASDVFMNTPIREGLNHWPMEYIYAHKEPEVPGVVIASEFSAVCSILNGALRVNPYDIQNLITIIDKALSMDMQERAGRRFRDIDFVSNSPSDKWTSNVLRDLKDAISRSTAGESSIGSSSATPMGGTTPMRRLGKSELADTTAGFLARESIIAFPHLKIQALKEAYDATTQRVIVLDFNGTIVLKEPPGKYLKREILGTSGNKPPPQVLDALGCLCQDAKNTVFVVSGDSSENVISALGDIPGLGLATSNGAMYAPPVKAGETRRWKTFDLGVDWDAVKRVALPVLSKYTARSNGSFVKLTSFSIGWSYYSCDPEWGSLQASHLVLELESELRAFDVRFVTLKGIVEIVPRKLNKGLIVKKLLRDVAVQKPGGTDFILCMGDDISDEKMFTSVFSYIAEMGDEKNAKPSPPVLNTDGSVDTSMELSSEGVVRNPLYSYAVAVGRKASHASSFVYDAQEVANALVLLAKGEVPEGGVPVWGREVAQDMFT